MNGIPRRKSPRAPSISLDEALDRVGKAYEKTRLHPSPTEVVAQSIGYKSANSGAALAALASMRYYGLLDRPKDGMLAVVKDFEAFRYAPNEALRRSFLHRFLRTPALFAELLDKYTETLPSDADLKNELIQRGFLPAAAASLAAVFRRSVEFLGNESITPLTEDHDGYAPESNGMAVEKIGRVDSAPVPSPDDAIGDRIPVRLAGGRRAWLVIPAKFYAADKERLKAQIDLLLTEEDETGLEST